MYYEDIYRILVFLFAAYGAGCVTKALGMPALVGEIIAGLLLGPPLADFVPFSEALVLIGEIGLIFLLIEAGIELDIVQLRQTGGRAMAIALTGSLLPIGAGLAISLAIDKELDFKGALAVGFAFAPTSLGVASCALSGGGISNTPVGQLVMAACVLSDIIGLVLLSMFQVLVKDDPKLIEYFIPIISSFGFLIIFGSAAIMFLSRWIETSFLGLFPKSYRTTAMFTLLFSMAMGYLPMMYYTKASYLAGAFLVGATFSLVEGAHEDFTHHTKSIMEWLLRIFFSATIGFQVPVKLMKETDVIVTGLLFFSTCVLIKLFVAYFVPNDGESNNYKRDVMVTGLSMICRGELNFIIAAFALNEGVISPKMYASVVFAVLLSAITSPYLLLRTINYFKELQQKHLESLNPQEGFAHDGTIPLHLHLHLETNAAWSLMDRLQKEMVNLGLVIEDYRIASERGYDSNIVSNIYVRDSKTRINISSVQSERKLNGVVERISQILPNFQLSDLETLEGNDKFPESLREDEMQVLLELAEQKKEKEFVEAREKEIMVALRHTFSDVDIIALGISPWTPWQWNYALDSLSTKLSNGQDATLPFFMNMFEMADLDGSGDVDESELLSVFDQVGLRITKEGLSALIAAVDEDGDGVISRQEWKDAITLHLEKKEKLSRTPSMSDDSNGDISFPVKSLNPQADGDFENMNC